MADQQNTKQLPAVIEPRTKELTAFSNIETFESAQRMAKGLAESQLVPMDYRGKIANCLVALEMAQRTGSSVMAVMQNLHIIQGRPAWSAKYIIAAINSSGRFAPLRFRLEELGDKEVEYSYWTGQQPNRVQKTAKIKIADRKCIAWTYDRSGEILEGPAVTIEMAVLEGWYTKNDSKWRTMPDLMIRYRAASMFGNLYAPDVLFGMQTDDDMIDVTPNVEVAQPAAAQVTSQLNEKIRSSRTRKKPDSNNEQVTPTLEATAQEISVETPTSPAAETEEGYL